LFVQRKEDRSESRTNWIGYVAVATDEDGAARARQARHRRGVARRRRDIYRSISRNVDFEKYTSAVPVLHCNFSDDAKVHGGVLSAYTTKTGWGAQWHPL
jgi:hypothetical protein